MQGKKETKLEKVYSSVQSKSWNYRFEERLEIIVAVEMFSKKT